MTTGQDREYDGNRVQSNPVPNQFWCQHHPFQHLSGAKNQQDHDCVEQVLELENSGQDCGKQTDHRPQVRHDAEQAGTHANNKSQVQANQPQARGVDDAERKHDHQLPADKGPKDFIYFDGQLLDRWFDFPGQQSANSLDKQVPVPQQVKRDHGDQDQVHQPPQHSLAAPRNSTQNTQRGSTEFFPVGLQRIGDGLGVQGQAGQAQFGLKPGKRGTREPLQ